MKRVYLDHNATAPLRPEARAAFLETLDRVQGNPSSVHGPGRDARALLDEARARVAGALGVHEEEITFTSGATEANNLALQGSFPDRRGRLVTVSTEHSSILDPARDLEQQGVVVVSCPVDSTGQPEVSALVENCRRARLVSLSAANNETGALGPVRELVEGLAMLPPEERPRVHTDAVQALGRIPLSLAGWGVDLASFSGHKLGAPPGAGVLVRRKGTPLAPLQAGGGQESGLRPGTENTPAIVATSVAMELAIREQPRYAAHTQALVDTLWGELSSALPDLLLLGPEISSDQRLPNTLNILRPNSDGHVLVTKLDLAGLAVSAGSACASGSLEPSHVLQAMGLNRESARAGLRLSLGTTTTPVEIAHAVGALLKSFAARTTNNKTNH